MARGRGARRLTALGAATALALSLAACAANDGLADDYREGSNKGYIAAGFEWVEIAADDRGDAVEFTGTTEDGETVTSEDLAGKVAVVNFWYAACGPCIAEAPVLESVWQEYQEQDVVFLGVNTYDQPATAQAFARENGVTYPSLIAIEDRALKLAFATVTPIQATPTTLVLDREGRVAARIIGQLEESSILSTLVGDQLAESP